MTDALDNNHTLMFWAALHRKDLGAVQNLINEGVDINTPNKSGMTPLLIACYLDNTDIARELLKADAVVTAVNNSGQTPLHLAAKNGNTEIVTLLLKHECRIDARSKFSGMTALHEAAQNGHSEIVKILLENGAKLDVQDLLRRVPEKYATTEEVKAVFEKFKDNAK